MNMNTKKFHPTYLLDQVSM